MRYLILKNVILSQRRRISQFLKEILRPLCDLRMTCLFLLLIAMVGLSLPASAQDKPIKISRTLIKDVSETLYLDYMPGNIFIANPKVCNFIAIREQRKVMLIPTGPGTTSLTIQDTSGKIRHQIKIFVKVSDLARIARELKDLLGDIEGIEIKIIGRKVLIDGEILLPRDFNRIGAVASQYDLKKEVGIIARLNPLAQKIIAQKIEEDINKLGSSFKEIRVRAVNQRFLLEGTVDRAGKDGRRNSKIAEETAKTYVPDLFEVSGEKGGIVRKDIKGGPAIVVNLLIIKPKPQAEPAKLIQITAHYVELNKTYAKNFAFNWTPGIRDSTTLGIDGGKFSTTVTATISSLIPKLNTAKTHGHARILESSTIIVQDNETGTLENITEIPITVLKVAGGATQQSTEFKDVGLTMQITPTIIPESDNIQLKISFKLQTLIGFDESGKPSIGRNRIDTILIVKSANSAAIGGLVTNTMLTDYNKIPPSIAADQGILFNLYRSKSFQSRKSQFVVFITPHIIPSASTGVEKLKRKFRIK